MMGRRPGSQAVGGGGWDHRGCPMEGGYPDKPIPNTAWLCLFFGQEMAGRVRYEMDVWWPHNLLGALG